VQLTADYGISAYLFDEQNLYVNLYVPSEVSGKLAGKEVKITQTTSFPITNVSSLRVDTKRPATFGIQLRIPAWAGAGTRITVNGKEAASGVKAGSFAELRRSWKRGDVIEVHFDMGLRLEPLNEAHPEMVAVMTGPLVLFPIDAPDTRLTRDDWLSAKRESENEWLVVAKGARIRLKPFMAITDETYRLYNLLPTES
jgi:DUF1680 family protein